MTETPRPTRKRRKSPLPSAPLKLWQDGFKQEEVRIEIIPLIDVIFCILTFFILAAVGVSRQQAISLNLPKASSGSAQMQDMLIVSLDNFGQVYLEQNPVGSLEQLAAAVKNYFITRPDGVMVLYASKEARYDEVIQVLDILREAGGDRVALATLPKGLTDTAPLPINPNDPLNPLNSPLPNTVPGLPDNSDPLAPGQLPLEQQLPGQIPGIETNPNALPSAPPLPAETELPSRRSGDLDSGRGIPGLPPRPNEE
ncbi:MAG: biopolymer transporter ExbD [Cyanobacteria bacterium P01_G01_bin.54]